MKALGNIAIWIEVNLGLVEYISVADVGVLVSQIELAEPPD